MTSRRGSASVAPLALLRRGLLAVTGVMLLAGCPSLEDMNQIQKEWDAEHPPGTGVQFVGAPKLIKIIATYEATERQRQVALQRGRQAAEVRQAAVTTKKRTPAPADSSQTTRPREEKPASVIAVSVPPDERKQGKETVMLYDVRSLELVGNEVYDLSTRPKEGEVAIIGNYTTEYVGSGVF